ncbi:MAG TPA: hypothetical protein VGP53_02400 [Acidimicrobiales bacterium]|nr:hypothetical protein [Acidimicrobiales bacterium]
MLVAVVALLGLARPAAADFAISGSVSPPSSTTFGKTVTFTGTITNIGTVTGADNFTSITIENNPVTPSPGMTVPTTVLNTTVTPGQTVPFSVSALITGLPGTTAQIRLKATGVTGGGSPTTTIIGTSFTVSDAVVISATAERIQGATSSPCPVGNCQVSIHDGLRYSVKVENLADPAMTANVTLIVPAPVGTTTVPARSTVNAGDIGVVGGTSRTLFLEVAVNDPPGEPQPDSIILLTASAV